jgi:pimeloyl-ACP methyl ester carboxylesterase
MKNKFFFIPIAVALLGSFLFAGCGIIVQKNYSKIFGRVEAWNENKFTSYFTWNEIDKDKYFREEVFFYSGANKLQGFIYGTNNHNGLVVISEGFGGTADSYFPLIMYFVNQGWRVFAFNNTGVSGSEGDGTQGLYQSVIDLDAALNFIEKEKQFSNLPVILTGHSWGGFAVCAVLNYPHRVSAVVSFAGFNSCSEVLEEFGYAYAGKKFNMVKPYLQKIEKQRFGDITPFTAIEGINKTDIPVMIVQCSNDDVIRAETSSIYAHREKITNPNVQIIYRDNDDAAGHQRVWASSQQREYMKWADSNWKIYYQADPKHASLTQWAKEINFDKNLSNEMDTNLMKRIHEFLIQTKTE